MNWKPIETAPKDGSSVLLCWAVNADGKRIDWTKDLKTAQVFVQVAAWWEDENEGEGSWTVYCDLIREPLLHFNPTHWMPLPEPPAALGQD